MSNVVKANTNSNIVRIVATPKVVSNKIQGLTVDTDRFKNFQIPTPTPNGTATEFTTPDSEAYTALSITVYRDQLSLQRTVDYVETDPTTGVFTLVSAPKADEVVWCNYIKAG